MKAGTRRQEREEDKWIGDLAGAICDPIIVWPSGWKDSIPEWVFPDIKLQRLLDLAVQHKQNDGAEPMASDLEVMVYMYPLSLESPLSHDWAEIYLYVATQAMKRRHPPTEVPGDIKRDSLTRDQMRDLDELKRWLYRARIKARKEREWGERQGKRTAEKKEQMMVQAEAPKQLQLM